MYINYDPAMTLTCIGSMLIDEMLHKDKLCKFNDTKSN